MSRLRDKINWSVVGFLILGAFTFVGLRADRQNADDIKYNAKKEAHDICVTLNEGRAAMLEAQAHTGHVQRSQAEGLLDRFAQNRRLNPPTTPREAASAEAGEKFFRGLVEDTERLTGRALEELESRFPITNCDAVYPVP